MNKITIIFIAIVFIGSIGIVNLFGMEMAIYNQDIPVTSILCINETEENVYKEIVLIEERHVLWNENFQNMHLLQLLKHPRFFSYYFPVHHIRRCSQKNQQKQDHQVIQIL